MGVHMGAGGQTPSAGPVRRGTLLSAVSSSAPVCLWAARGRVLFGFRASNGGFVAASMILSREVSSVSWGGHSNKAKRSLK